MNRKIKDQDKASEPGKAVFIGSPSKSLIEIVREEQQIIKQRNNDLI
jgi:hypothetical protein